MSYCILVNGIPHHAELLQSILLLPLLWELLLLRDLGKTLFVAVKQQDFKYLCLNKLSPSFGVVFNVPVQISELLHGREHLQKDKKSHNVHVSGTFIAPQPMLLMKSTGLVMLGAVGNLDAVFAQRIFPQDSPT